MTFAEELKAEKNPWIIRIGQYLQSRDDIKNNLKKENKSLKECFDYILQELSKKAVTKNSIGYCAGDDEELYALAVHYYDEDNIKIDKHNFKTNANGSASVKDLTKPSQPNTKKKEKTSQEIIDKAVAVALEKYRQEEKEKLKKEKEEKARKKKEQKVKKESVDENQLSLLDFGFGDD